MLSMPAVSRTCREIEGVAFLLQKEYEISFADFTVSTLMLQRVASQWIERGGELIRACTLQ